jgi:hypothetical protein
MHEVLTFLVIFAQLLFDTAVYAVVGKVAFGVALPGSYARQQLQGFVDSRYGINGKLATPHSLYDILA